ncbi:MAG: hypothetical protein RL112_993 [Planctomycetota bacterium]
MPANGLRRLDLWCVSLVVLLVGLAFAGSLANGHVYDDVGVIQNNPRLDDAANVGQFFTARNLSDEDGDNGLYRPLTMWSYALDRAAFGKDPFGVHLVNVLMNALLAGAAYLLARGLGAGARLAAIVALVYGLHPVHTEVVANGVGRAEIGAALFALVAGILHFRHLAPREEASVLEPQSRAERRRAEREAGRRAPSPDAATSSAGAGRSRWWLGGAVASYFVALLFKETAVTLPGLLFLLDWFVRERGALRPVLGRVPLYLAYAPPLVAFFALRNQAVGGFSVALQDVMAHSTTADRVLYASETLAKYVGQLFAPLSMCADYSDYRDLVRRSAGDPGVLISFGAWIALGATCFWLARRQAWFALAGIAWFALAILPVSNILLPIGTVRGDRLLFLPSLGFAFAFGAGLDWLSERARLVGWAAIALILGAYMWRTHERNLDWRSQETLWTATTRDNPGSAVAWFNLGDVRAKAGRKDEAERCYERAFELRDGAGFFYPEAHNRLAALLVERGDRAGAEAHYRLVVERAPRQYTALVNLGQLLMSDAARRDESIALLQRAVEAKPDGHVGQANLAQALGMAGRLAEATKAIDAALRLRPLDHQMWQIKASIAAAAGDQAGAAEAHKRGEALRGAAR